ncbi:MULTISPECIES: hypothetical protein [unclassified Frondihabitans]|uniref:hypothetical protein n=1 Tax=unclassified Frondihabitans TaxID=2626248 RepID=UPI000F5162B2|nr:MULTISPECIES: hypothetical protein [unclassified Frondihabitans]RPE78969.1 hypothetical protein EDF37_1657 [Frondihabitans sp. PhB153]RPF09250.1 hypothetical protein EDF39_1659 [Frondihabitans sp. PhB161]
MTSLADAFRRFKTAERAAVEYNNADLTPQALQQERARRLTAARKELQKVSPAESGQGSDEAEAKRQEALAGLVPTNADTVATVGNEWAKVEALLRSGRGIGQLVENATPLRIAAIMDRYPTYLIDKGNDDPAAVVAEVTDLAMSRLADLGNPSAVAAAELDKSATYNSAWRGVIAETTEPFPNPSVNTLTALYSASRDDHETVQSGLAFDAQFESARKHVDASRVFGDR